MNPLLLKFTDGTSFLVGMGAAIAIAVARLVLRGRISRAILGILWAGAAALVVMSSTPLPISMYVVWGAFLAAAWIVPYGQTRSFAKNHMRLLPAGLLVAASLVLSLIELSYRWTPRIPVGRAQPVVVIGDSISAGIETGERTWPDVLRETTRLAVTNLARPGATVESALAQAATINQPDALALVEIGGNDILGTTDSATFRIRLDRLLERLYRAKHRIVMFELPLPPLHNRFGKAQRDLAGKYGAVLIPKRFFAHVLGLPGATRDGLHLSQKGHDSLARLVGGMLEIKDGPLTADNGQLTTNN